MSHTPHWSYFGLGHRQRATGKSVAASRIHYTTGMILKNSRTQGAVCC
ncbi:hypothetical protein Mal15_48810 [Stieleria maiorica]|uniref:Uncharacterized protein n=1 Tax=Stieleria maiorica TaxID=2795974 RepID=A0A5B9MI43_9BACT|nr:hypothetical protein Mal15_48810 [Stieleria maiorica]